MSLQNASIRLGGRWSVLAAAMLFSFGAADLGVRDVAAQGSTRIADPLYLNETARRAFHDGFAVGAHVAYRGESSFRSDGMGAPIIDPLGLAFSFDYQITPNVDLGTIIEAVGSVSGRPLSVSWVTVKYYHTVDYTDYAFRLAVDPASDGRMGFPQLDATLITTSTYTPTFSTDAVVGMRRVRKGYEEVIPAEAAMRKQVIEVDEPERRSNLAVVHRRALGWEIYTSFGMNFHFDPAASNLFLAIMADGGEFELVEIARSGGSGQVDESPRQTVQRGAALWMRSGIEYNRPSYQVMPFLSIPIQQWSNHDDLEVRTNLGVRFMLR
jgi:hypothetical protein